MKIVFMGTPDFAARCLESLFGSRHEIAAIFTQPDKPVGRKQIMTPPAVKVRALQHDASIPIYQPKSLRTGEAMDVIRSVAPDVIVVVAYGKILPKDILDFPRYGCVNVHGSLLPKYRGAAPIQWAVINGESETGVTIMKMDEGVDTGDMLYKKAIPIGIDDTAESMFEKLADLGAQMLIEALDMLEEGSLSPEKQDDTAASYAPMLSKDISVIDWSKPAKEVHDLIRGLYSWPVAHTFINGKKMKILKSRPCESSGTAGTIFALEPFTVACGSGSVIIEELRPEGKKAMAPKAFLAGHKLAIGTKIGE